MEEYCIYENVNPIIINQVRSEVKLPRGLEIGDVMCLSNQEWYECAIPDKNAMKMHELHKLRWATKTSRPRGKRSFEEVSRAMRVLDYIEMGKFDISKFTAKLICLVYESTK